MHAQTDPQQTRMHACMLHVRGCPCMGNREPDFTPSKSTPPRNAVVWIYGNGVVFAPVESGGR